MRVLFLAIDGVLNHTDFAARVGLSSDGGFVTEDDIVEFKRLTIDPLAVDYVNMVLDALPDVQVVVLSSWHPLSPELVERTLVAAGLHNRFHGHTRRMGRHDGDEASAYVLTHKVDDYVILTDCTDVGYQITKAILTQSTVGMKYKHTQEAISRFDASEAPFQGWAWNTATLSDFVVDSTPRPEKCRCGKTRVWSTWPSFVAEDECPGTCPQTGRSSQEPTCPAPSTR